MRTRLSHPTNCHLAILGDAVDAEILARQPLGDERDGAAADERIEHETTRRAAGQNARLDERFGEYGKVGVAEFGKRDRPDRALVASQRMKRLIPAGIVQIARAAVLARLRRAAANAKMPPAPPHATVWAKRHVRLADRVGVVVIVFRAGEEEDVLVIDRRP